MSILNLLETEKAFKLQNSGVYVLVASKKTKPNKIQLAKALKLIGLTPIKINSLSTYSKKKKRGKFWNIKTQKRDDKFMVYLPKDTVIDEEKMNQLNNILNQTITQ